MSELQPGDHRNSRKLFRRTLNDDPVLIKVHIAAHIGNAAHNALLENNDLHLRGTLEIDLVFLDERNGLMFLKPVLIVAERRISRPFPVKQKRLDLFLCILFVAAHFHILDADRKDEDEKNDEDSQNHPENDPLLSSASPMIHSKTAAAPSPEMDPEAAPSKTKSSSSK